MDRRSRIPRVQCWVVKQPALPKVIDMFCNYCGAQNPNDASFCSACGTSLARTVSKTRIDQPVPEETRVATATPSKTSDSERRGSGLWLLVGVLLMGVVVLIGIVVHQSQQKTAVAEELEQARQAANTNFGANFHVAGTPTSFVSARKRRNHRFEIGR